MDVSASDNNYTSPTNVKSCLFQSIKHKHGNKKNRLTKLTGSCITTREIAVAVDFIARMGPIIKFPAATAILLTCSDFNYVVGRRISIKHTQKKDIILATQLRRYHRDDRQLVPTSASASASSRFLFSSALRLLITRSKYLCQARCMRPAC